MLTDKLLVLIGLMKRKMSDYNTWFNTVEKLKKDIEIGNVTRKQIDVAMECQNYLLKYAEKELSKQEKPKKRKLGR